jgi:hypothetical protein
MVQLRSCTLAAVKIAYTLWQVLTGAISVLDGLKKIGLAVLGFLLTPFRWVNTTAAEHQHPYRRCCPSGEWVGEHHGCRAPAP